ncbi:MAG: sensor histidine kinase KdpD [Planctomycetes bacterium]|nr:sensor histidine kinase KdpD [Planctomycetota bacterium]
MSEARPDPDALLATVQAQESANRRGRLKVFLGACAGVGKTYAMLEAAQKKKRDGFEIVVGIVETHGRKETEALLQGLERLPPLTMEYRGARLNEFDLEGALKRKPALILVDELAHTNVPGCRHAKRWQDVEMLLDAGMDVFTTVNVQHLESQNDVVAQITGIVVRETVPDRIIEQASEIEVVDIPPDELLQRLKEGRVYVPEQAERASENFFKKGTLIALRQLALRVTADRVDRQMLAFRDMEAIREPWPIAERIVVCVGPSPTSADVIRAAKRLATRLRAQWVVAYVETPQATHLPQAARERVLQHLRLAEQLGAESVTLSGHSVNETIAKYAKERNATKIVIGKPVWRTWRDILFGSQVDQLVRRSGDVDVYVIRGEQGTTEERVHRGLRRTSSWGAYGWSLAVVLLCTLTARLMFGLFNPVNLVMMYLAGVVLVATRFGRGPSILASILSVAAFDVFFVPPYLTLAVADTEYLLTFTVLLITALLVSGLTNRVRSQADSAVERERRTAALYALSRELAGAGDFQTIMEVVQRNLNELFRVQTVFWLPDKDGTLRPGLNSKVEETAAGVARWVFDHRQRAGLGTTTLPASPFLFMPLMASNQILGVLAVKPLDGGSEFNASQGFLLDTLVTQAAMALEREQLVRRSNQAQVEVETERLRNALLSSVSHDLRTPLAAIKSASSLLASAPDLNDVLRHELIEGIHEEADYINRLVGNLLEMTRLEAGAITVKKEWQPIEEVVGAVVNLLGSRLASRPFRVEIPDDCPMLPMDGVLIQQVLFNLLENAIKYTPPQSPIELKVTKGVEEVTIDILDRGPGLKAGEEGRIFEKFYRANSDAKRGGVGLGLTICKGIVSIHGGRIWAENRPGGGAAFRFTLPVEGQAPSVDQPSAT